MSLFLQQLINGIAIGSVYAVFAIGFTLTFSVLRMLNLAHAAVFTWGSFFGLFLAAKLHLPFWLATPAAMVGAGVLALVIDYVAVRPLRTREQDELGPLITTFGALGVLTSAAQLVSRTETQRFPPGFLPEQVFAFGDVQIRLTQILIIVVSVALTAALTLFLQRSRFGTAIRAVAIDRRVARLMGIPVERVTSVAIFLAGMLGGGAGILIGFAFNAVFYNMGEGYLLRAITAVVLGGFGSIPGALLGSLFIGIAEAMSVAYGGGNMRDAIVFTLLVLTLIYRPSGLLGRDRAGMRL